MDADIVRISPARQTSDIIYSATKVVGGYIREICYRKKWILVEHIALDEAL
jgi:hypothetical protein